MAYGQSSGTTAYNPFASDLLIDALGRCGIFDIQSKHMQSGRRSMNLLLTSSWSNKGVNLWKMTEVVVPLIQGVTTYNLTSNIAAVYDTYRRQYYMNAAQSYPVNFSTVQGSPQVTIQLPGTSAPVGSYINIQVPVSVGGLVLYGFYIVIATPTANSVTVVAPELADMSVFGVLGVPFALIGGQPIASELATSTVTGGGVVPQFITSQNSATVVVVLPNHGLSGGQPFSVAVSTPLGGIQVFGSYTVQTVVNANAFTIQANANALSNASAYENGGQAFIATQNQVASYSDISTTQLSRNDYVAQADKTAPGAPTTLWVNKQIIPQFSVWPVTDNTGPYEMHLWCLMQIEDVNPSGGQTLNLPPRFYYALVLDLARDLSMTYAPARYADLKVEAVEAWAAAEGSDVEPTSTFMIPNLPSGLN